MPGKAAKISLTEKMLEILTDITASRTIQRFPVQLELADFLVNHAASSDTSAQ